MAGSCSRTRGRCRGFSRPPSRPPFGIRHASTPPAFRPLPSTGAARWRRARLREVAPVPDSFDARRSATSRVYEYRIWNQPWRSPFWHRYTWHVPRSLDVLAMRAAATVLVGEHDFSAFRAADCDSASRTRRVLHSGLTETDNMCTYRIQANAFLKHMVRTIVGTLVSVGTGELSGPDVADILRSRDRTRAGATVPPQGLCLVAVSYD